MNDQTDKRLLRLVAFVAFVVSLIAVLMGGDAGERFAVGTFALLLGVAIGRTLGEVVKRFLDK